MANLTRFYVDKKLLEEPDKNGLLGGEHSRMIDVGSAVPGQELNPDEALEHVVRMLEDDEVIGSAASISVDFPGELEVEWI